MKFNFKQSLSLIFGTLILNYLHTIAVAAVATDATKRDDFDDQEFETFEAAKAPTVPCPRPAWTNPDKHGIYTCPPHSAKKGYWSLMECPFAQATSFTPPTPEQTALFVDLTNALVAQRPTRVAGIGKKLHLQFCSDKKYDAYGKLIETILVGVTVPGYNAYNGPFFLVRWRPASLPKPAIVIAQEPHDDFSSAGITTAFEKSNIEFYIKNGFRRISGPNAPCSDGPNSDCAHSIYNGFYIVHQAYTKARPNSIALHFHGTVRGSHMTNGFKGNSGGKNSLIYAASKIIADAYPDQTDFKSCSTGTLLPAQDGYCGINQAWVEVRNLTCSQEPQCKIGTQSLDRVLGFELNIRKYTKERFFSILFKGLEDGFLKTRGPVKTCVFPTKSPTNFPTKRPTKMPTEYPTKRPRVG